ncbi:ADP compounds hydrolase NudE [Methylomarinum sp. Ch1-1]|uniref:ADP compounds hydrolase NudE n=1 Tax=Methylomarinum roseum TaxID=3067653 RepID=A0AAU7NXH9_9GAMM|nr:ADP compounds hydrolase NudE [Methylomarinum sp. Ch1-1]MDP4522685.1 ADP compounds hydrolase NudE [Methylomarinum sp. Ch1-1]
MIQKPKILAKSTVARSRLFHIEALELEFSNGEQRNYERLIRGAGCGAVLVVPLLDNETVLLVREYGAGLDRYELGLPKGKLDPGEDYMAAANRELKEEIGYGAKKLQHIMELSLAPSYMEHSIDVVIAMDLYQEKLPGDEPEELQVVPWKIDDIPGLLASGECSEARSIAALYLTLDYLNRRRE